MEAIDPKLKPRYKYHYYSSHGVCLPNYYPSPSTDTSYMFSSAVIMANGLVFLGIVLSYGIIYW